MGSAQVFVIGGVQLYAQAVPLARRLVLTEVDADLPGDTFFPAWDRSQFTEVSRRRQQTKDGLAFDFVDYRRN